MPNIDINQFKACRSTGIDVFGLLNTFSGGALHRFSIFAMGIMPYITSSIIVQLLSMDVIPRFAQWAKEGDVGRKKLAQITRYGTVILGLIQAFGLAIGFNNIYPDLVINPNFTTYALIAIVLTAGTSFLMWLGEQITEHGIGNGISIIIFAGIVAGITTNIKVVYQTLFVDAGDALFLNIVKAVLILVAIVAIIAGVIFVQQGIRKIPVQYAKRVVGRKMYGGQSTHIPLKVNAAGVIPVIFALSLLMFPSTIAQFWSGNVVADWIIKNLILHSTAWYGLICNSNYWIYVLLHICAD